MDNAVTPVERATITLQKLQQKFTAAQAGRQKLAAERTSLAFRAVPRDTFSAKRRDLRE